MQNNELYHHGVKNMKWGVRRYQNKDGSLTPLGRRRAMKLERQYLKVTGKKINNKQTAQKGQVTIPKQTSETITRPKTSREMTDDELKTKTNRLNLENNYDSAVQRMNQLHPQKVSKGKAFVNKVMKDVIVPAATEASKNAVKNYLDDVLKKAMSRN